MSQKLEEAFRSSLQNKELDFDPKAWEMMSARLDQVMPVSPKGSLANWWIAAGVVGAIGIGASFYLSNTNEQSQQTNSVDQKQISAVSGNNESVKKQSIKDSKTTVSPIIETQSTIDKAANSPIVNLTLSTQAPNPVEFKPSSAVGDNNTPSNNSNLTPNNLVAELIILPKIGNHCQGEELVIENKNKQDLQMIAPSGRKVSLKANSSKKILFEEAGNYTINSENKSSSFLIISAPKTEFDISNEDEFIEGVPTINVSSTSNAGAQSWIVKGTNLKYSGTDAQIHLFEKGKYEIVLTTTKNGCESSTYKVVSIHKDYNLLAPSGFRPMDSDSRTKTFMPFALKERNTPFQLIVIDPRDGHILFQSNDENRGWDGIDNKTGQLASNSTNYLWKVNLEKPLKGEKQNYSGSVTIVY